MQSIVAETGALGLRQSQIFAQRLLPKIARLSNNDLSDEFATLNERFEDEVKSISFLYLKPASLERFGEPLKSWSSAAAFSDANYDMEEAEKCFALNRFTASVMHSMRVLEVGLANLCRSLKVRYDEKSWQQLLLNLEKKWKEIVQRKKKPVSWKRDEQFYSESFAEFRHFKDAWRNHAMHARATYDEERAEVILDHVKSFMRHLATRLKP